MSPRLDFHRDVIADDEVHLESRRNTREENGTRSAGLRK